jgi:RNA polymerase sigma-70 factor (ECF subfamily)
MERPLADDDAESTAWLADFHRGRRSTLDECYRERFAVLLAAASRVVPRVDAETVVHEVFYRLLTDAEMRASFRGGDVGAWLARIATNRAIDHRRRVQREVELRDGVAEATVEEAVTDQLAAHELVARFRRERLPEKWSAVFEARFVRQLGQGQAAAELGLHRTTLMYQEHRIRSLLRRFLLREDPQ